MAKNQNKISTIKNNVEEIIKNSEEALDNGEVYDLHIEDNKDLYSLLSSIVEGSEKELIKTLNMLKSLGVMWNSGHIYMSGETTETLGHKMWYSKKFLFQG